MAEANIRAVITADDRASATLGQFGKNVSTLGDRIKTGLKVAAISAGAAIGYSLVKNLDNAIKRVDTLANASRTFENLGFSANDVNGAMKALDKSIRGLPTPLDEAVRGMNLIASATNDVGKSQKIYSALNDAILGFGGTAEMVSNAVVQLSQDLAGGKITAQTWLSLLNSGFGPALSGIARDMGITMKELRSGLSKGTISVQEFTDELIKMDKKGGGGMKSFHQIAKDSTKGISTSWENMQTAITRGLANIITSIGQANIANAIQRGGQGFEFALNQVIRAINLTVTALGFLGNHMDTLLPVIALLGTAFVGLKVKMAIDSTINAIIVGFNTLRFITIPSLLASLTALQAFFATPWGLAIAAASLAIAALTSGFMNNKTQADNLRNAQDSLKNATNELKDAQDRLKNSSLGLEGAQLNLEQAQRNYTQAVRQFGPRSLEARQALHQLRQAQWDVKVAHDETRKAQANLLAKEREVAKDRSLIKHLQEVQRNLQGVGRDAFDAGQKIQRIDGSKVTVKTSKNRAGVQTIDFVSTFGRRALGGPIVAGRPYLVGERGPEMVIPNSSGTVIPNNRLSSGSQINLTIAPQIGVYAGTPTERRKLALTILSDLRDLANQKNITVSQLLGANRAVPMS